MKKQKEYEQLDLFSFSDYRYQITKPIRLIEFFAGVGFQRMGIEKALKDTSISFESWRTTEWAIPSILAYDIVHNFGTKDTQFADKEFLVDTLFKLGVSINYNEPAKLEQLKRMNVEKLSKIYNAILRCHNLVNIMNVKGDDLGIVDTDKYEYILTYSFPHREKLTRKLMDILEPVVDEKYYLSKKMIDYISADNDKWTGNNNGALVNRDVGCCVNTGADKRRCDASNYIADDRPENYDIKPEIHKLGNYGNGHHAKDVVGTDGLSPTITTGNHGLGQAIAIKNANSKGYELAEEGDGIDISSRMESHRGTVQKGRSQTLTCKGVENVGVVVKDREDH